MCGRRRQYPQPAYYSDHAQQHPASRLFAALNGATPSTARLDSTVIPSRAHIHGSAQPLTRGCCPRPHRQQHHTLTGLAVNAVATAVEQKNAERNARAAAMSSPTSAPSQAGPEERGVVSAPRRHTQGDDEYEAGKLEDMMRELGLATNNVKTGEKEDRVRGSAAVVVAGGVTEEAPPAYTPTPAAAPAFQATRNMTSSQPAVVESMKPSDLALPTTATPLLARHVAHPTIVADLQALEAALREYSNAKCGGSCAVKRARKQLVRDLGVLEAERLNVEGQGWGNRREARMEMRRAGREVKREGRVVRGIVRGVMRGY